MRKSARTFVLVVLALLSGRERGDLQARVGLPGVVYAGTSPDGKVYRIDKGKATELFAPKSKYIWALAFDKDGSLFVGTGDPGNVYRVDKSGKSELYYESGQSHVTALA